MPEVLLIGWDGAGWSRVHPLLDSGAMPNLTRLVEKGVSGPLATLTPLCSPLLWTSVATGQFADTHGILDTVEPDPRTGGVRPVTKASLRAVPVWEILARAGLRCRSVGWPATHPAAPPATCVSDGYPHGVPGSIYPRELESSLLPLRFKPQEWTGDELRLFVPELEKVDQEKDKRLARLAVMLADDVSTHAAATTLMESAKCDFSAVWYGAVGRASALFPAGEDDIYREAVNGVYRFLDLLLGRLLVLAGPDATVILVSDRAAGEPEWHPGKGTGPRGIFCAAGPGIAADELTFGAGLLDIAPTILGLFDFSPAPGMAGQAVVDVCPEAPSRSIQVESRAPQAAAGPEAPLETDLLELEKLGYADIIAAKGHPEAEAAKRRRDLNLARVLLARERAEEALPLLEPLAAQYPADTEIGLHLGHAYFLTARYPQCRQICEALLAAFPDSPLMPLARAHLAIAAGEPAAAKKHLASSRQFLGIAASLDTAVGEAYLKMRNWSEAEAAFRSAILTDAATATAHAGLAQALVALGRYGEAAESALDAIRLRYDLAGAHFILGTALQILGRKPEAASAFATARKLGGGQPAA